MTTVVRCTSTTLLMAVLAVALTACGSAQPAPGDSGGSGKPKVENLVVGVAKFTTESNRPETVCCTGFLQLNPMYEFLMGVTPEGEELVPQLATEWNLDTDGKSYRFKLRKGTPFHNSKGEFTAKDVRFTWEDIRDNQEISNQPTQVSRNDMKDVEIVNDHEVVLRLNAPNSGYLSAISQAESAWAIRSKADRDSRANYPPNLQDSPLASTGSYRYLERSQGQYLKYARVPDHWRKVPEFSKFEYRVFPEASTMLAALLAKEIQIAALPPDMTPQAAQAGFKVIPGKSPGLHAFMQYIGAWINRRQTGPQEKLNPDPSATFVRDTPFLDARVRKALNKAIDRNELNKAFVRGRGEPLYVEYFHASRPGWNPAWQQNFKDAYGYDPEGAKKLLAEAGYGPSNRLSRTVRLTSYPYFPAAKDMAEAIANYWRAIGVDVKLDEPDPVAIAPKDKALESEDRASIVVTSIRQWLGPGIYNSGLGVCCRSGVQLPELDAIYGEIKVTLDPQKYSALWRKWGDSAFDLHVNMPLFWIPSEAAVDPNIIADYPFPGSISSTYTHFEYVKAK